MKILAITQARYGSTRLPAKILKKINDMTLLEIHLRRVMQAEKITKLLVATTNEEGSRYIIDIANKVKVGYYQGSIDDVLDRYHQTAKPENPDYVVRITSDCPLIDPNIIDQVIEKTIESGADYVNNTFNPTFPDGMDCECFKFSVLERAQKEATLKSDREHVTPYIWRNSSYKGGNFFHSECVQNYENWGSYRITVDTLEDFAVVKELISNVGINARCRDYVDYLKSHKEIVEINACYERNEGYVKSLKND